MKGNSDPPSLRYGATEHRTSNIERPMRWCCESLASLTSGMIQFDE